VIEPQIDSRNFRPHWTVKTRVMALAESGKIGRDQLEAAIILRRWVEVIGRLKVQSWNTPIDRGRLAPARISNHQLTAARELRAAASALGPERVALLQWCVVDDTSWRHIATRLRLSDKTAVERCAETLRALALWRARQPVPPAPRSRFRNQPSSW
jgi:hypothetical protein